MGKLIDFSKFTFTAEQIRDINELIFDDILHAPDMEFLHTIYDGILYDKEVGFITESGLVGKKAQGCDPTAQDWSIGTRKVLWKPKAWEVIIDQCATELESTMAIYCMNKGVRRNDLTDTDYMAIAASVLGKAIKDALFRIIWFSDSDAKNVADGGIITAGVDVDYFNVIDAGFFKHLQSAVTTHPELLVTVDANKKASKKEQMDAMTPDAAYNVLTKMYYAAPIEMRASGNMRFYVTQSIADAYQQKLTNMNLESTYKNLTEGVKALSLLGVDVIPIPIWDRMIQSYNDLGAKFQAPHRAALIEKANLGVGTPSNGAIEDIDIFYDKKSRINRMEASDQIDAELLNDARLIFAQ